MFPNKKNKFLPKGDQVTTKEAALESEAEIAERCDTISEVVQDKVMSLSDALEAYDVTTEQYMGYMMMQGRKEKVALTKAMVVSLMKALLDIMDVSATRDSQTKKIVDDMRQLGGVR